MRLEADSLADGFRMGLQHLPVSQKNGPDLGELGLDASKAFIGSRRQGHEVRLEACLVAEELGLCVDEVGLAAGEVCQRFLQPSVALRLAVPGLPASKFIMTARVPRAFLGWTSSMKVAQSSYFSNAAVRSFIQDPGRRTSVLPSPRTSR